MLRARIGNTIIIGLEAENIKRLQEGQPIVFNLETLGIEGKVVIFAGETKESMVEYLMDKLGLKVPPSMGKDNMGKGND